MPKIGLVGMALLLCANVLLITPWSQFFPPTALVASALLTVHAVRLRDTSFIVVNGFVTVIMLIKTLMTFHS